MARIYERGGAFAGRRPLVETVAMLMRTRSMVRRKIEHTTLPSKTAIDELSACEPYNK